MLITRRSLFGAVAWLLPLLVRALEDEQLPTTDSGKRASLQDLVTWDARSLFVRGERIMFYSGEIHPFRLPVPGLWLDLFQKIKALGYTGASFYVDWRLLEGKQGDFSAEGVFAFEPFFDAAREAGLYLLVRPGPYINAEVAGGGFPGWLQREPAILRTNESGFVDATRNYVTNIGKIIAQAQITHGGPVIALQAENEYTYGASWVRWPDVKYMETVNALYREAGIVVPLINNEASAIGLFTPGKPGGPDIYGHDSYPIGWTCSAPSNWTAASLPTNLRELHLKQSPDTPYSIPEFQGGAIAYWGGSWDLDQCAALIGPEVERVFYKNLFGFGIAVFNIYMTYGGTNWGNLGQPGAYTSYDYGAVIKEDRTLFREKYVEAKLIAQFIKASPAYLTATPGNPTNTSYVSTPELSTTPIFGNVTNFYVTRHSDFTSLDSTSYALTVPTSVGNVTIPQLGGALTLHGRDSKVQVTDYDVGGYCLLYSSAEIYTHGASGEKKVLLLYGNAGETHEFAFSSDLGQPAIEGDSSFVKIEKVGFTVVVQWKVTEARSVLHYGNKLDVYLLWRNSAFNYWVIELEADSPTSNYTFAGKETVIANAGYLLRTAKKVGTSLYLTGDLNATTTLEVIAGFSDSNSTIYFNGAEVSGVQSANGRLVATLSYSPLSIDIPDLSALDWKYIDSLPEIQDGYDDSAWTEADRVNTTNNARDIWGTVFKLSTPTSLVSADYGYHTGSLIYRGRFLANGNESSLFLETQGGSGFGHSVWINSTYLGSFNGEGVPSGTNQTLSIPPETVLQGQRYVITVVIDHMGEETKWTPGYDSMKTPRGILNYALSGHPQSDIAWKVTGNLGGENYVDKTRGPLNEGALYAERHGFHLPVPPSETWASKNPISDGIKGAGAGLFSAAFDLNITRGWDVPMAFVFTNTTHSDGPVDYRAQLYVNGYQFGRYINNLGPQTSFPVPQGILNYSGANYIAITLWSQCEQGAQLGGLQLVVNAVLQSGMRDPGWSPAPAWAKRDDAY